jgi:4-amino-4-deoxychorismate lyase
LRKHRHVVELRDITLGKPGIAGDWKTNATPLSMRTTICPATNAASANVVYDHCGKTADSKKAIFIANMTYQFLDNSWQPASGIAATDRGFRYGMSIFETIGIANGRLLFLDEHLAKLSQACAFTGFRPPPSVIPKPGITNGVARIYVTAGDGAFRDPVDSGRIVLMLEERPFRARTAIKLSVSSDPFVPLHPGLKTGNYWPNIVAYNTAGFDEIVLINAQKHVVSASMANLFAVIDGILMTPRPATGARVGVIRDWVSDREDVVLAEFHPEQLADAAEIFLTNSGYGIGIVSQLGNTELPKPEIGPRLLSEYRKFCGID